MGRKSMAVFLLRPKGNQICEDLQSQATDAQLSGTLLNLFEEGSMNMARNLPLGEDEDFRGKKNCRKRRVKV